VELIKQVQHPQLRPPTGYSHRAQRRNSSSDSGSPERLNRRAASSSPPRQQAPRQASKRRAEKSPQCSPAKRNPLDSWTMVEVRKWMVDNNLSFMIPVCIEQLTMNGKGLRIFRLEFFADYPSLNEATLFLKNLFEVSHAALLASHAV